MRYFEPTKGQRLTQKWAIIFFRSFASCGCVECGFHKLWNFIDFPLGNSNVSLFHWHRRHRSIIPIAGLSFDLLSMRFVYQFAKSTSANENGTFLEKYDLLDDNVMHFVYLEFVWRVVYKMHVILLGWIGDPFDRVLHPKGGFRLVNRPSAVIVIAKLQTTSKISY